MIHSIIGYLISFPSLIRFSYSVFAVKLEANNKLK